MTKQKDNLSKLHISILAVAILVLISIFAWTLAFYSNLSANTPIDSDWNNTAKHIKDNFKSGDFVAIVPFWASTGEKHFVQNGLPYRYVRYVSKEDWPNVKRLWVVSAHDSFDDRDEFKASPVKLSEQSTFGAIELELFELPHKKAFIFIDHLHEAEVFKTTHGKLSPCEEYDTGEERFICDKKRGWQWIGKLVQEIGDSVRETIWSHPITNSEIHIRFYNAKAKEKIVFHTGLTLYGAADKFGEPVIIDVLVNGQKIGKVTHPNEIGWLRHELDLTGIDSEENNIEFVISTTRDGRRHFSFDAYAE